MQAPKHTKLALALLLLTVSTQAQLPAGTRDASSSSQPQQDPLRIQANDALNQHDYPAALKLLTTLVARNPTDPHLLYDLASTQDALDQPIAVETYRRAIEADPKFFEPHLALSLLLARQGDTKAAQAELNTTVTLDAPDPSLKARAYRTLARINQPTDPAGASTNLLAALKLSPETPDDVLLAAELAEASNNLPAAEAAYRRILITTPYDPAATSALTHILLRQNKADEAEALLTAALARNPSEAEATPLNAQLATVYMASSDPAKSALALPLVEKLHASHPKDPAVTRLLAGLYARSGEYAKADPLYATLISFSQNPDPTLLDDRADTLIHLKRPAEAQVLLMRALANPAAFPTKEDLGSAASHLAFAASQNNDPQGTLQALALRATVLPQSPSGLFLAATAHDKLHQAKEAADLYKQFLSVANGKFPDEEWEARHRLLALRNQK